MAEAVYLRPLPLTLCPQHYLIRKNISEKSTKIPLSLSADKLRYSDLTKEVNVSGNVELIHDEDVFHTDKIDGNTDSEKYIIPNFLNWTRQNFEVNAKKGEYYGKLQMHICMTSKVFIKENIISKVKNWKTRK